MKVPSLTKNVAILLLLATETLEKGNALSTTASEAANVAKRRLQESLSSLSNKMTISPEIIIPEPTDPTALLLQSTDVTKISLIIRNKAKGNAVFISGSMNSIKAFCAEQETARGNFPGPLPVIYCESSHSETPNVDLVDLSVTGVSGLLYPVLKGEELSSVEDVRQDGNFKTIFQSAIENGIQLIPDIVINPEANWNEKETDKLVDIIEEICGSDPAAIVLTVGATNEEEETKTEIQLPKVSKSIGKRLPILGSIRTVAGGGRMGSAVSTCKEAGFKGVLLRSDCLPGFRMNPDLEFVGGFWGAAIGDLKSTKSKNFNFRSKVALDRDIPMEWFNYQKNVMESGALGGGDSGTNPMDTDNGDYSGF
mmetsp:Transcript_19776/g.24395  ORF Transcript_19776/g.24395 Transcript_19776/m.24395 type:complete len:367 (+) Transcript_19776:111-1211(+)